MKQIKIQGGNKLNGTIVENCTAYGGKRQKLKE